MSELKDIPLTKIDGSTTTLADFQDQAVLIVNVASRCGNTPQYAALEELQRQYGPRGFTVLGFPCNQFMGQEPGSNEQIAEYCSTTWGVTFPILAKIRVNGWRAHPLYRRLKRTTDAAGKAGAVRWNFEKFGIAPDGSVARFRPKTLPDSPEVIGWIESHLPATV